MKHLMIDPEIEADPQLLNLVRRATEILEREVLGPRWKDQVLVRWEHAGPRYRSVTLRLLIEEDEKIVDANEERFLLEDLANRDYVERQMSRTWGDLLQVRSHRLIEMRGERLATDRHLDGSEALDEIIDSVADYSEREGREPRSLKLPIRYAAALLKLGPTYWGGFYEKIRESGLRAFDGQVLLGMSVELVPGADAELQVA